MKKYYYQTQSAKALIQQDWKRIKATSMDWSSREEAVLFAQRVAIVVNVNVRVSENEERTSGAAIFTP
jgi:hypothetical protein